MKDQPLIVLIEDNSDIVDLVRFNLEQNGFRVATASDGVEGLREVASRRPALILLDLMLPKKDGLSVCRDIRTGSNTRSIPIIMLTAKGEEEDIVRGLEAGADDYVVKPFSPRELVARVRSALRRHSPNDNAANAIRIGEMNIDPERFEVRLHNKKLTLTRAEFRLVHALAAAPGRVFTRDQLIEKIGGPDVAIVDRNIDVHVSSLRKKLKDYGQWIETVRGVGYRFSDEEDFSKALPRLE